MKDSFTHLECGGRHFPHRLQALGTKCCSFHHETRPVVVFTITGCDAKICFFGVSLEVKRHIELTGRNFLVMSAMKRHEQHPGAKVIFPLPAYSLMIAGLVWWSDSWIPALAISSPFFGHDGAGTAADQCDLEDFFCIQWSSMLDAAVFLSRNAPDSQQKM